LEILLPRRVMCRANDEHHEARDGDPHRARTWMGRLGLG